MSTIVNGKDYNGDDFDAITNPFGFGAGGHMEIVAPAEDPNHIELASDIISDGTNSLRTSSSTTVSFGTGAKTWTLDNTPPILAGQSVRMIDQNDTTQFMTGIVTSFTISTKVLILEVSTSEGGGSSDSWLSSLDGPPGATGEVSIDNFQKLTNVYQVATGSANAYVLTPAAAISAYAAGHRFVFRANFSNTGTTTVNISAVGAQDIFFNQAALSGNEILTDQIVEIVYDGTQFNIISFIDTHVIFSQAALFNQVFS